MQYPRIELSTPGLKDQTIHIRIAGVDAPEAAHFGRPAQPFAPEALAWLKNSIEGKTVYCQLIRRDQYSRIVCFNPKTMIN
jgi:endonuclease YncB( thermonuclease family)